MHLLSPIKLMGYSAALCLCFRLGMLLPDFFRHPGCMHYSVKAERWLFCKCREHLLLCEIPFLQSNLQDNILQLAWLERHARFQPLEKLHLEILKKIFSTTKTHASCLVLSSTCNWGCKCSALERAAVRLLPPTTLTMPWGCLSPGP